MLDEGGYDAACRHRYCSHSLSVEQADTVLVAVGRIVAVDHVGRAYTMLDEGGHDERGASRQSGDEECERHSQQRSTATAWCLSVCLSVRPSFCNDIMVTIN